MDIYRRLAKKLDSLPHGFPAAESGVELKILRKIFSTEDAETALKLKPIPEPAEKIAKRFGKTVEETQRILDGMAEKGQIFSMTAGGKQVYALVPFVVGIYEFQLERLDRELAELCEEYMPILGKVLGGSRPALARVVPINRSQADDQGSGIIPADALYLPQGDGAA